MSTSDATAFNCKLYISTPVQQSSAVLTLGWQCRDLYCWRNGLVYKKSL